jgi:hypothetical protein
VEVAEIKARNLKDKHGCRPQFLTSLIITSTIPNLLPAEQVLTQATNVLQLRNFMGAMHVDAYRIYSFLRKKRKPFIQGKGNSSQLSDNQRLQPCTYCPPPTAALGCSRGTLASSAASPPLAPPVLFSTASSACTVAACAPPTTCVCHYVVLDRWVEEEKEEFSR